MISSENSLFLIIDIQEKLVKMLENDDIVKNTFVISKACDVLNIPVVVTEQYPKGLGETVFDIKSALSNAKYFEKTSFSALQNEDVLNEIEKSSKKQRIFRTYHIFLDLKQLFIQRKLHNFKLWSNPGPNFKSFLCLINKHIHARNSFITHLTSSHNQICLNRIINNIINQS